MMRNAARGIALVGVFGLVLAGCGGKGGDAPSVGNSDATLSALAVSPGSLAFSPATTAYSLQLAYAATTLMVTATLSQGEATLTINNVAAASGTPFGPVTLTVGANTIPIVVVASDHVSTKTYTLTVIRLPEPSHDATLSSLALSQGTLAPAFSTATTAYAAQVPYTVASVTVTPTAASNKATLTVNGTATGSGAASAAIALTVGTNPIAVVVTAEDGTTIRSYTVTVTRLPEPSHDADLSGLGLSSGTLSPTFAPATTVYGAEVPYAVSAVTVTPSAASLAAAVRVNGAAVASGATSPPISLVVGNNSVVVIVTAEDGITSKSYALTITRRPEPSHVATLSGLGLSSGTLSPTFAPATTAYSAEVPYAVSAVTVTPTATSPVSTLTVNAAAVASGATSAPVPLAVGSNSISVVVTAEDGTTTTTYAIVVTRRPEPSHVADLSGLVLSSGTLAPAFAAATTSYTAQVLFAVASVAVTPTTANGYATVKVNDTTVASGVPSSPIPLGVGVNAITVVVTAEDGTTTRSYAVAVTRQRELSHNADLSALTLSQGSLAPAFAAATTAYAASVSAATASLTVTATTADANATLTINGAAAASGAASQAVHLDPVSNTIAVTVLAEDGTTSKTYGVQVARLDAAATFRSFDFESGWGSWYADNGVWEVGVPTSGPNAAHGGTQVAATVLGGNYPATTSSLISPTIALPTLAAGDEIQLRFWHWFSFAWDDTGVVQVQVQTSPGVWSAWTPLVSYVGAGGNWSHPSVDLTAYAGKAVHLAFTLHDGGFGDVGPGWYLDDVTISVTRQIVVGAGETFRYGFEEGEGDWWTSNGVWEIGVPTSGPGSAHAGTQVAATVLAGNYSATSSSLVSPSITLPAIASGQELQLRFWHWFGFAWDDAGMVQVQEQTAPGVWSAWATLWEGYVGAGAVWTHPSVELTTYAGKTIRLAFTLHDGGFADVGPGWYLDDVTIGVVNPIVVGAGPGYGYGFEAGEGDWWASNGSWQVGAPTSGPGAAHGGTQVAATVLAGNYSATSSSLVSPSIALPALPAGQELLLRFWHWFSFAWDDAGYVQIQVQTAPGTWGAWTTITGNYSASSGPWTWPLVDLTAYAGKTVRLAFTLHDGGFGDVGPGWYLDDITIGAATP